MTMTAAEIARMEQLEAEVTRLRAVKSEVAIQHAKLLAVGQSTRNGAGGAVTRPTVDLRVGMNGGGKWYGIHVDHLAAILDSADELRRIAGLVAEEVPAA